MEILINSLFTHQNPETMVGALLGTSYINNHGISFGENIAQGQELCRQIDDFMENSPVCRKSYDRISPRVRKYSQRVLRIYYDHLLARNWDLYFADSYENYCDQATETLQAQTSLFPYKPKRIVKKVVRKKMLYSLNKINGLDSYVEYLVSCNYYNVSIQSAIADLVNHYNAFNQDFNEVFPQLLSEMEPHMKNRERVIIYQSA